MRHGIARLVVGFCSITILGSLALHLLAGPLCLSARSVSGCQRCCQPETSSEEQAQPSPCTLFCCTGLPGALGVPIPPVLTLAVTLPDFHGLSTCLAPTLPPPRFSLSIQDRRL
jgi:hypothetical protein